VYSCVYRYRKSKNFDSSFSTAAAVALRTIGSQVGNLTRTQRSNSQGVNRSREEEGKAQAGDVEGAKLEPVMMADIETVGCMV